MKKILFISCLCFASISTFSQNYRKVKFSFGGGFPALYMEPAYRITDKWSVGLRLEGAVTSAAQSILTGSYGPNGQYYFLDKNGTRFFAGLGVGLYTLSSAGMMCDCSRDYEKNKIGFYPRLGFDVGHLTITTEYNVMSQVKLVGKSMIPNLNPVDNPTYVSYVSGNYFTAKIGVAIGGGKRKRVKGIAYCSSPVGELQIESENEEITMLGFLWDPKVSEVRTPVIDQCISELSEYFSGRRKFFSFPIGLRGSEFQVKVWSELLNIPFGKTISYQELAIRIGDIKSIRAVGLANGQNPVAIAVPCHRVIGKSGDLVGYGGGLERKVWLLEHEGAMQKQLSIF